MPVGEVTARQSQAASSSPKDTSNVKRPADTSDQEREARKRVEEREARVIEDNSRKVDLTA